MSDPAYRYRWQKQRPGILARDGYLCQIQGPLCTHYATTVDHINPVVDHGNSVPPPHLLRAACGPCNSSEGGKLARRAKPSRDW